MPTGAGRFSVGVGVVSGVAACAAVPGFAGDPVAGTLWVAGAAPFRTGADAPEIVVVGAVAPGVAAATDSASALKTYAFIWTVMFNKPVLASGPDERAGSIDIMRAATILGKVGKLVTKFSIASNEPVPVI